MNAIKKTKDFILSHKVITVIILAVVIFVGHSVFASKTTAPTRYVTTAASSGTVVVSVTGSGQVSASNTVDLTSKASGTITYVGAKAGDVVRAGKNLFSIDATDAEKAVRDAKVNLQSAQLDLQKFQQPPTDIQVSTVNNAILDAQTSKDNAARDVQTAYRNLLNSTIAIVPQGDIFNFTPPIITGVYTGGKEGEIDITIANTGFDTANSYAFATTGLVNSFGIVSTTTPQPIGDSGLFIEFPSNNITIKNWVIHLPNTNASNYTSNEMAYQNALASQTQADRNADLAAAQQKENLTTLYTPDPVDLQTKQLAVEEKQDALTDAETALSDYYITAPFSGTIATVTAQVGQTASGTLGTIITDQKLAQISLNEIDVSKIKLGDKATLTFDAVPDLSIAGTVDSIDPVGTVSQGVVTYTVKIGFDTNDDRIKPGMSVSAAIVTDIAQNVLTVPNSAVKTANGSSYVQMFATPLPAPAAGVTGSVSATPPEQVSVTVGLSNDTTTEITSGLKEGDLVVSRTIIGTTTTVATTATAPSLLGGATGRTGAGGAGAFRAGGR